MTILPICTYPLAPCTSRARDGGGGCDHDYLPGCPTGQHIDLCACPQPADVAEDHDCGRADCRGECGETDAAASAVLCVPRTDLYATYGAAYVDAVAAAIHDAIFALHLGGDLDLNGRWDPEGITWRIVPGVAAAAREASS